MNNEAEAILTFLNHPCFVALKRPRDVYDGHAEAWEANFVGRDESGHKAYLYQWGSTAEEAATGALARLERGEVVPFGDGADNVGRAEVAPWQRNTSRPRFLDEPRATSQERGGTP